MMLIQGALKQHWENVAGKAATLLCSGRSWVEGGARLDGEVGVGTQRMLSSAHTHTDLRQENGSSLNLISL